MAAVSFDKVDIIFGRKQAEALALLDQGADRAQILEATEAVLGVADASLDVAEGEICVLMGLSGSGKSTLLRAVNGLNKVTRGRVLVRDGDRQVDIASCDDDTLCHMRTQRVAMVFQQFALLPWRTVAENVGLGLEIRGMGKTERTRIVDEKLEMVQLSAWRDKYAHELSGGMQQRVGLARAFATDADILLMDEPFSALDPLIRGYLQDELLTLQRELRKTIIFVSHDLDEALKLGNQIAIMEAGRIVQLGNAEAIVRNPANDYVAEFVAHMNPLSVLSAGTLMQPLDQMARIDGVVALGDIRLQVDAAGALDGPSGDNLHSMTDDMDDLPAGALVAVPPDLPFRRAIEIRRRTGAPVLVVEDGKLLGKIGEEEIYQAIL